MATNPYSTQSSSGYNASPPADDGSQVAANVTKWSHVTDKIGGPLKTFIEAVDAAIVTMGTKVINTDADENNTFAGSLAYTASTITLSSGAATGTRAHHVIAAESGTSDDFDTLTATNYSAGDIVYLRADSGDTITVTTAGNFNESCVLDANSPTAFIYDGSNFYLLHKGWTLIESQTASASATLDFENGLGGEYDAIMFVVTGLLPATDGDAFWARVKDSTYQSDAADYEYATQIFVSSASTYSGTNSQGAAQIVLGGAAFGNAAGEEMDGVVVIYSPDATQNHYVNWDLNFFTDAATPVLRNVRGVGAYNGATNAITGYRFMYSTGNIASGTIAQYGFKK